MTDTEKQIQSPCIRNCCLNTDDVCLGCFRHVDEIIEWSPASNERKGIILDNAKKRKEKHGAQWGD